MACQGNELYRLLYDGLFVRRLRVQPQGEPAREFTLEVLVWSDRRRFTQGLSVGLPAADIVRLLGPPTEQTPEYLRYRNHEGYEAAVTFGLRDGRVAAIRREIPVD